MGRTTKGNIRKHRMLAALLAFLLAVSPLLDLNPGFAEERTGADEVAKVNEETNSLLLEPSPSEEEVFPVNEEVALPLPEPSEEEFIGEEVLLAEPSEDAPIIDASAAEVGSVSNDAPETRAAGDPLDVALAADNGSINFDGAADSAAMSLASEGAQGYNMKVTAIFPSAATTGKSITISLAEGLSFVSDGSDGGALGNFLFSAVENEPNAAPFGVNTSMETRVQKRIILLMVPNHSQSTLLSVPIYVTGLIVQSLTLLRFLWATTEASSMTLSLKA